MKVLDIPTMRSVSTRSSSTCSLTLCNVAAYSQGETFWNVRDIRILCVVLQILFNTTFLYLTPSGEFVLIKHHFAFPKNGFDFKTSPHLIEPSSTSSIEE